MNEGGTPSWKETFLEEDLGYLTKDQILCLRGWEGRIGVGGILGQGDSMGQGQEAWEIVVHSG